MGTRTDRMPALRYDEHSLSVHTQPALNRIEATARKIEIFQNVWVQLVAPIDLDAIRPGIAIPKLHNRSSKAINQHDS